MSDYGELAQEPRIIFKIYSCFEMTELSAWQYNMHFTWYVDFNPREICLIPTHLDRFAEVVWTGPSPCGDVVKGFVNDPKHRLPLHSNAYHGCHEVKEVLCVLLQLSNKNLFIAKILIHTNFDIKSVILKHIKYFQASKTKITLWNRRFLGKIAF